MQGRGEEDEAKVWSSSRRSSNTVKTVATEIQSPEFTEIKHIFQWPLRLKFSAFFSPKMTEFQLLHFSQRNQSIDSRCSHSPNTRINFPKYSDTLFIQVNVCPPLPTVRGAWMFVFLHPLHQKRTRTHSIDPASTSRPHREMALRYQLLLLPVQIISQGYVNNNLPPLLESRKTHEKEPELIRSVPPQRVGQGRTAHRVR